MYTVTASPAATVSLSTRLHLQIYAAKHAKERKGEWVSGNLVFFRMHRISDIYFVGGFGTVQWVDVADYMATKPDSIVAADPQQTISVCHTPKYCYYYKCMLVGIRS